MSKSAKFTLQGLAIIVPLLLGIFLLLLVPGKSVHAQNTGQGGTLTVSVPVLTNASQFTGSFGCPSGGTGKCQGIVGVFPNIGQATHALHYCLTSSSSITGFQIILEESPDNGTNDWASITPVYGIPTRFDGCAVIEAGGYFNNVRARILTWSGSGGVLNATYSASTGPISFLPPAFTSSGSTAVAQCDQEAFANIAAGASFQLVTGNGNQGIHVCGFTLSFTGSSTGFAELQDGTGTNCGTGLHVDWEAYMNAQATPLDINRSFAVAPGGNLCFAAPGTGTGGIVSVSYAQY